MYHTLFLCVLYATVFMAKKVNSEKSSFRNLGFKVKKLKEIDDIFRESLSEFIFENQRVTKFGKKIVNF